MDKFIKPWELRGLRDRFILNNLDVFVVEFGVVSSKQTTGNDSIVIVKVHDCPRLRANKS